MKKRLAEMIQYEKIDDNVTYSCRLATILHPGAFKSEKEKDVMKAVSRSAYKCKSRRIYITTPPSGVGRKNIDTRNCNLNAEVMLSSFASLLSSAVTNGVEHPLLSSEDPTLSRLLTHGPINNNDNVPPLSFPSFCLKNGNGKKTPHQNQLNSSSITSGINSTSSSSSSSIQDVAARSLESPLTATLSTIDSIPSQLLQNLTASLKRLIDSRMRSSFAALLRTMKGGLDDSIMGLLLVTLDPIRITTVVTSFTVVTPTSTEARLRGAPVVENSNSMNRTVTLPLILEAIIDAKVLSKMVNLTLHAPGTITGTIHPTNMLLTSVSVAFDTMALLKSMMSQARIIVKKGIREAAYISGSFRKNAELNGLEGFIGYNRSLQNFHQPPHQNDRVNDDSNNNPKSQQITKSSSSRPSTSSTMQEKLLTSYPNHLRQTVEHFLPAMENADSVSIEGFPSHLAKTLLSLSKPNCSSGSSGNEGTDGDGSLSDSRGGSPSQSRNHDEEMPHGNQRTNNDSHQVEGMQNRHQRANNNSHHSASDYKREITNNALIIRGDKNHDVHPSNNYWIQNIQPRPSFTILESSNNNKVQQHRQNSVSVSGGMRSSPVDDNDRTTYNNNTRFQTHKEISTQHQGHALQGQRMIKPSSTNLTVSSDCQNKPGNSGYGNITSSTNYYTGAPTVTENQSSQLMQPPPKRRRTGGGGCSDDSYAERSI